MEIKIETLARRFLMNSRGFTMVELLVAAAIFSIVLTGLTIAFIQQQRQSNLTQEDIDLEQTARASLNYIASEIRNATSRQGKTFSLKFVNGGSIPTGCAATNTTKPGTVNSPPDCLTIYTWDITRGEDTTQPADPLAPRFPSTPGIVSIISPGPPLVLQLPLDWFKKPDGTSLTPPLLQAGDLLGFRSRMNLCSPDSTVNCGTTPGSCTECSAILKVSSVDTTTQQATINDDVTLIKEQNFPVSSFSSMTNFINGVAVNGVNYGFIPTISSLSNEMTIVQAEVFSVDTTSKQLEMQQNGAGSFQPIAGGSDAPGIVDIQFVFNLQDADGGITKVGICSSTSCKDTTNRMFSDFNADPSLLGRQKDIRSVEIYLLVRSRVRTPLIEGRTIPVQAIPAIGDVPQRQPSLTSDTFPSLRAGYMYRVFSATVYIRNMAREDFG
jgi:prepilin-type N-terminal cleavage/methylation domain-containing protein